MFGFVDDGYRMARHLGTKRPQLPQKGCGWIAHAYQTMGGQRQPAVSAGMKDGEWVVHRKWTPRRRLGLRMHIPSGDTWCD